MYSKYPWLTFYAQLKRVGFCPDVIYDIGAASGSWSRGVAPLFPKATFHLFEPLADHVASYREGLDRMRPDHARYHIHPMALGESSGTATLAMTPDPLGSTALDVGGVSSCFPEVVERPQHSLDELFRAGILAPAQLLKLDVQGSEDRILRGAKDVLSFAQALQIECWLYPSYGPQTALMGDIVSMLHESGFIAVESSNPYYDSQAHQLCHFDLYFVREELAKTCAASLPKDSWVKAPSP